MCHTPLSFASLSHCPLQSPPPLLIWLVPFLLLGRPLFYFLIRCIPLPFLFSISVKIFSSHLMIPNFVVYKHEYINIWIHTYNFKFKFHIWEKNAEFCLSESRLFHLTWWFPFAYIFVWLSWFDFFLNIFYYFYLCVCHTCVSLYVPCVCSCLQRTEGVGSLWSGIIVGCKLPDVTAINQTQVP